MRRPSVLLVALALAGVAFNLASVSPARASGGTTWTYPGSCNTVTLQDCIDGASAGDTIELDANDLSTEFAAIGKTLTIGAVAGFSPTLLGVYVYDGASAAPMSVTLSGFTVTE